MSDYCSLGDVQDAIPGVLLDNDTVPSAGQADGLRAGVCNEIDGILRSRGYTLPITDAEALGYLKTVAIYGTAAAILASKFIGQETPGATFWQTQYTAAKDAITNGALGLDSPRASFFGEGFTKNIYGDLNEPIVTRGQTF